MENQILFEATDISKVFGATTALSNVSFKVNAGEIVGLIGENGAGKSTLLKIIQGVQPPTSGTMTLRGKPYAPRNPKESSDAGAGMVFQEQSLLLNLTVGQNIFFAREKEFKKAGLINWPKLYKDSKDVLMSLELENINPRSKVYELDFADRQMVEIAKVINNSKQSSAENSLILLDEPTSVLNEKECQRLFEEMYKLKEEGNGVVFISHRLDEVLKVSDRIYVLKNGMNVVDMVNENIDEAKLYEAMVGKESNNEYYHVAEQTGNSEEVVLSAKNMGLYGRFKDVSFDLHKGEILAICGVVGSGNEDVCACVCGAEKYTSGTLEMDGKEVHFKTPNQALEAGILSVPKNRNEEGVFGTLSIAENISMSNLDNIKSGMLLSKGKQTELAKEWIKKLSIKCQGPKHEAQQLSGGNVQKVVFSRVLASGARVVILNHPTRGVDIGAKEEIYGLIRSITAEGIAVILLGDTLEECIGMASNIMVMKDGYVTQTFTAEADNKPDQVSIVKYMV